MGSHPPGTLDWRPSFCGLEAASWKILSWQERDERGFLGLQRLGGTIHLGVILLFEKPLYRYGNLWGMEHVDIFFALERVELLNVLRNAGRTSDQ